MAATLEVVVKGTDHASSVFKNIDTNASGLSHTMGNVLKVAALGAAAGIGAAGFAAVKFIGQASNLNESLNKSNVVFGDAAKTIQEFADTSAKSFGIAKVDALSYAATLGTILKGSGLTEHASAEMSEGLVKLAADMASFNNIPIDQALEKIRAGLVGESEPLRTVGVLLSEAAVQEEAYASGIAERGAKLTDQQKVQARYNLILKQTADTQGDFERTSGGMANQQRILAAQWKDLQAIIGNALLPVAVKLGEVFVSLATDAMPKVQSFIKILQDLAAVFGAALTGNLDKAHASFLKLPQSIWPIAQVLFDVGSTIRAQVIPAAKDGAKFLFEVGQKIVKLVGSKAAIIALGGAIVALFAAWAVSAGIAAAATIAAAAPLYALILAIAAVGAAFILLEKETSFFSKALPVVAKAFNDTLAVVGPIMADALKTLTQGWNDLQPALIAVGGFLNANVVPILEKVGNFLKEHPALLVALGAAILLIVAPWLAVVAAIVIVLAKWDEIKAMFTRTIPEAINSMLDAVRGIPVIGAIFEGAFNAVKAIVERAFAELKIIVETGLNVIKDIIKIVTALIHGDWSAAWEGIKALVGHIFDGIRAVVQNRLDLVRDLVWNQLQTIRGVVSDAFNLIVGAASSVLKPIGALIAAPFEHGVTLVKNAVNTIIGMINTLIRGINSIPSINISNPVGPDINLDIPDIPQIPRLAKGGILTKPTLAMIAEKGPEAVVPLSQGGFGNVTLVYSPQFSTAGPAEAEMFTRWILDRLRGSGGI